MQFTASNRQKRDRSRWSVNSQHDGLQLLITQSCHDWTSKSISEVKHGYLLRPSSECVQNYVYSHCNEEHIYHNIIFSLSLNSFFEVWNGYLNCILAQNTSKGTAKPHCSEGFTDPCAHSWGWIWCHADILRDTSFVTSVNGMFRSWSYDLLWCCEEGSQRDLVVNETHFQAGKFFIMGHRCYIMCIGFGTENANLLSWTTSLRFLLKQLDMSGPRGDWMEADE